MERLLAKANVLVYRELYFRAAVAPDRYQMDGAAADAVVLSAPLPIAGEAPITSGDNIDAHGDVDMSLVAAEEVSAQGEAEASYQGANGQRRSAFRTVCDGLITSPISPEQSLRPCSHLSVQVQSRVIHLLVS